MPGRDYPVLESIPATGFTCADHSESGGVFADFETGCQVWHMCQGSRMHSFMCPNGTIFSEKTRVCDWWYNVECPKPIQLELLINEKEDNSIHSFKKKKRKFR